MAEYVILSDSCMDLNKAQRKQYNIEFPVAGSIVYPDGSDHLADVDWETITFEDFYHRLDKKETFKSGIPNQFAITSRVEEYFKEGKDVLAITLSGGMSGTYNAFLSIKEEVESKYKGRKLLVVDSRRYSGGISSLCLIAARNREKGMSIEDNFKFLEKRKLCLHQIGILDNLFFLHRSGRISKTKAVFGTMAGVKPMADFSNETGMPCVLSNARGYKAAYKWTEMYLNHYLDKNEEKPLIVIVHSIREEQMKEYEKIAQRVAPNAEIICCRMGQSNGVNVGPGLIAAFFFGEKPVSKDCEEERKTFLDFSSKK